jgi:hypothetical protein
MSRKSSNWKSKLLLTSAGTPRPLLANAITALRESPAWSFVLAYDEFAGETIVRAAPPWDPGIRSWIQRPWTSHDDLLTAEWLQREGISVNAAIAAQAVEVVARDAASPSGKSKTTHAPSHEQTTVPSRSEAMSSQNPDRETMPIPGREGPQKGAECTAGRKGRAPPPVSAMAITETGSIPQKQLRNERPSGLGYGRSETWPDDLLRRNELAPRACRL